VSALRNVTGSFLAFLDADDKFLPYHLSLCVEALRKNPELDGVYTDGIHINSQGDELRTLSSRRRGPFEGWLFNELVRASDVFGPPICVVIRRDGVIERNLWYVSYRGGPDDFSPNSPNRQFWYVDEITCQIPYPYSNHLLLVNKSVVR
jgi:hypothetical protein